MGEISDDVKNYIAEQLVSVRAETANAKAEAAVAKADAEAMRAAMQESREKERDREEKLLEVEEKYRRSDAKSEALAAELTKTQALNLPLCQEPAGMGSIVRENFHFMKDARRSFEVVRQLVAKMEPDASEDSKLLHEQVDIVSKTLDLRLVAFHAAMRMPCNQKMEFIGAYYQRFLPKIPKTISPAGYGSLTPESRQVGPLLRALGPKTEGTDVPQSTHSPYNAQCISPGSRGWPEGWPALGLRRGPGPLCRPGHP